MKKRLKFFIKLFFGIGILVFLFSRTSVQEFVTLLGNANYLFFVFAVVLYVIGQVISAKKWMIISQRLQFKNTFRRYINLYFLGMFYNMFLPTNIGGDIIKVTKLKDDNEFSIKRSIISVMSDRITGACVLVLFILFGFLIYNSSKIINIVNGIIILFFLSGIAFFVYVMKNDNLIPEKFKNVYNLIKSLCEKKCIFNITILSLIFHLFLIVIHYCIAQMYNFNIPFAYYLLLYPITAIVAFLPLSINGIGLKEFAYVYMLKIFEIGTSEALLFAMTFNMVILFASALGFIPYISKDKKTEQN